MDLKYPTLTLGQRVRSTWNRAPGTVVELTQSRQSGLVKWDGGGECWMFAGELGTRFSFGFRFHGVKS